MTVQALIAHLITPDSPAPKANKATGTPGERGEKGENPRPVWSGERANKGESGAKRGESCDAPQEQPGRFAPNSPRFAPDSPTFAPPRTLAITEDSPNSPLSPRVQGALDSPAIAQAANDWPDSIKELERLNGELRRKIDHAHLAARAEAIGNDLERRLIEGSEALAKPPAAQARHYFWLIRAEHEVFDYWACPPETRAEVEARYPGAEVEVLEEEGNADE
jgi:hypothetical protein